VESAAYDGWNVRGQINNMIGTMSGTPNRIPKNDPPTSHSKVGMAVLRNGRRIERERFSNVRSLFNTLPR
jgi:hypothetical protein